MDVNMNINPNYGMEAYRQTQAVSDQEQTTDSVALSTSQARNTQDTVEISAEGRAYMAQQAEESTSVDEVEKIAERSEEKQEVTSFTSFSEEWAEHLRKNPKSERVQNSFHTVDPDGSLYNKVYWAAYAERLTAAVKHVEDYYADRMKEFCGMSVQEGMFHLRNKYIDSSSSIFCSGMSAAERSMSYKQELTLFLGGNVIIGDPYALKAHGGLLNVNEMDAYAKKAAEEYLTTLLNNRNQSTIC